MEGLKELNSGRDDNTEQEEVEENEEEQKKGIRRDRNGLSSPVEGSESSFGPSPGRVSINAERLE